MKSPPVDLGFVCASTSGGITVKQVTNGRAGQQAGLQKGDKLIALNGWELNGKTLENELSLFETGKTVKLSFFRRGKLMTTRYTINAAPQDTVYLTVEDAEKAAKWL